MAQEIPFQRSGDQAITSALKYKGSRRSGGAEAPTRRTGPATRAEINSVRSEYMPVNVFYSLIRASNAVGYPVLDLGSSVEVDSTELPAIQAVIDKSHQESVTRKEYISYPSSKGIFELHQAIADCFTDVAIDPKTETMVSGGIMDAYNRVLDAFEWDAVVVPDWSHYFARAQATLQGKKVVVAPLDTTTGNLDLEKLHERLEQQNVDTSKTLIYITHPAFPLGTLMEDSFVTDEFLPFLRERGMMFFSDSYVRGTRFDTDGPIRSMMSYPGAKDLGVESVTLSKELGLPGVRIGGIVGNEAMIDGLKEHAAANINMISGASQVLGKNALNEIDVKPVAQRISKELKEEILPKLDEMNWKYITPKAGIDMMIEVPPAFLRADVEDPSLLACITIFRHFGVGIVPGSVFAPDGKKYLRIVLKQQIGTIPQALDRLKENGFNWETFAPTPEDILHMENLIEALDLTNL